jgi:hypothetical protein
LKDFADWAESSLGWSLPDRFPRNKKDAPWAGDDPKLWPPEAREKLARVEAEERDLRDRLRQQYEAALKELDRVPLSQALRMAAEAGKTDPWRWVMAKIREGDLRAWGTVGNTHDRPLEPPWLDHVKVFTDDDGHPRPPTDDCLWFEPGGGRPRRFSDISLDAGALTELLDRPSVFGAEGERALAPRSDTVVDSNHEDALAPNKRGPAGRKKAGAIARMVRAVEKGEKTIVQLQRMKQKELDNFYPDAGRTTLAEAHKEALKILRQNSGKTPTNDK